MRVNLKTYLEVGAERHEAVILNLSHKGCFVVTLNAFPIGAAIRVEVGQPGLLHMPLEGIVVHHLNGSGVGIKFKELTATKQALLAKLMWNVAQQSPK